MLKGGIATRRRKARDVAFADSIEGIREHDRQRDRCLLQCRHGRTTTGEEPVRRECDQFRGVFAKTIRGAQTKAEVEAQIVAGGPAVFHFVVGCLQT